MIGRRRWIAPAVVAGFVALVLAVPFERSWLDFEVARRGILGLVAAALAVPALLRARFDATTVLLLGLAAWHAVRSLGVANPMSGLARATHWLELWLVMQAAARVAPADLARAALPVLAAVAGFGLLQRLGWAPGGHGGPGEPVSTLGNLNVAAEVVAVCGGAAAAATVMMRRAWCGALLLGLAGIYLAVNGTRAGWVALPLATVPALAQGRGRHRLAVVGALAVGVFGGLLLRALTQPRSAAAAAGLPEVSRSATVEVRARIWQSCLEMAVAAPVLGVGSGQFAVEYPRYRHDAEIELSTHGRVFPTSVDTAHQDHLEVLVETGVVGLALLWGFLAAAARRPIQLRVPAMLAPFVALLVLSLLRSPFANAPAVALALAAVAAGGEVTGPVRARGPRAAFGVLLALPCLWFGASQLFAQHHAARYLQDLRLQEPGFDRAAALAAALRWCPWDSRLRALHAQESFAARRAVGADVRDDLDALQRSDPHNTTRLVLRALLLTGSDPAEAKRAYARALELDPRHPEAALGLATLLAREGLAPQALAILYRDPHPRLLAALPAQLPQLAALQRDPEQARLLTIEARFLAALLAVRTEPAADGARRAIKDLTDALMTVAPADARPRILAALHYAALGRLDEAGRYAPAQPVQLAEPHRRLLQDLLPRLAEIPEWQAALAR